MSSLEYLADFVESTQKANEEIGKAGSIIQNGWEDYNHHHLNEEENHEKMLQRVENRLKTADKKITQYEEILEDNLDKSLAVKRMSAESSFSEACNDSAELFEEMYDELSEEIRNYRDSMKALYAAIDHERLTGNF